MCKHDKPHVIDPMASHILCHQEQQSLMLAFHYRPHHQLPRIQTRAASRACPSIQKLHFAISVPKRNWSSARLRYSAICSCRSLMASTRGDVKVFDSVDDLASSLAGYIADLSDASIKQRGAFSVALSGGSLISTMRKLTEPPYLESIDWSKWHIFWADERVVARDDPDSNYKLAKDGLLSKVPVVQGQVYSISDALSAEGAAEDYEFGLRQLVKTRIVATSPSSDFPRFDLILLGMGPDGHVASLFPNHPLTHEHEKWISLITDSPKPPPNRITFTFPVINAAANVAMVLMGANKADVLLKALGEELPPGELPAQMVAPNEGKLVWFLDKNAASKL